MQGAASKATSKLAPIQEVVKSVAASATAELRSLPCAPSLTWNVLKALLLVMGKTADQMDTWLKCRSAAATYVCITVILIGACESVVHEILFMTARSLLPDTKLWSPICSAQLLVLPVL